MKTIKDYRAESTLNKKFRYPEGIMSRKEWLQLMKGKGYKAKEEKIRNYAAEERAQEELVRRAYYIPMGNPNYPATKQYLDDKEKLKIGIFKTEYSLGNDRHGYVITKTEYDYYLSLVPPPPPFDINEIVI